MGKILEIDEEAFAQAEKIAGATQRTVSQVVEDALRKLPEPGVHLKAQSPIKLHTFGGDGLQPGVDLSNNSALADLMDEFDGLVGR